MVDDEDYDIVIESGPWQLISWRTKEYAKKKLTTGPYETVTLSMHELITGWSYVHHVDNNGLNNQMSNLKETTHKKNIQLQIPQQRQKSSAYRGVSWFKPKLRWRVRLKCDGREIHIGYFDTETEAAIAWNTAALTYYGSDSYQNIIY